MKITKVLNSKFILTFFLLTGMVLTRGTASDTTQDAIRASSFDAVAFLNKGGSIHVNVKSERPTKKNVVADYEKPAMQHKDMVRKRNTALRSTSQDCWEVPVV